MLLTAAQAPAKTPHLFSMAESRDSPFPADGLSAALAQQPVARSFGSGVELTSASREAHQEEVFARLAEEANKPQPGQAEKAELIRTSSAPSELPLPGDPPMLQTSGLDWSGSVDGATLMRVSQELGQAEGGADAAEQASKGFSFPRRVHCRPAHHAAPAMSRVSEDCAKSLTLSDSNSAAMVLGDAAVATTDEGSTPTLSKGSSLTVPHEIAFESPFEAAQFQEEPIMRPATLPEVAKEDVARAAISVPPSQLDSLLTPSLTDECDSRGGSLASRSPTHGGLPHQSPSQPPPPPQQQQPQQQHQPHLPPAKEGPAPMPGQRPHSSLSEAISIVGRRQTGAKSLSVLERDGIPNVAGGGASLPSTSAAPSIALRQKLAEEAGFVLPAPERPSRGAAHGTSERCQTAPTPEMHRLLDMMKQASPELFRAALAIPASGSRSTLSEATIAEEEDMMAATSLQQALRTFQPVDEPSRSPTRAPSLFDLAAPRTLGESSEWILSMSDIELGRCIGSGSYGDVYRAQWRHTDVAVKRLTNVTEELVGDFKQEVALMSRLKHPNVVQFLGATVSYPNLSIVTQFMPRGSLFNLLHRANVGLDDRQKMWMALDCAKGMHYLHSCKPPIVHGDVSSKNMLVDRDFSIRVADFGMSRQRRKAMLSAKGAGQGTAEWTAPEILRGLPYTESCDVYSFGVVLYELMTQQVPWAELSSIQVVGAVGWGNASLQVPDDVSPPMRQLMAGCMQRDPTRRPTFEQVIVELRRIRQELTTQQPDDEPPSRPAQTFKGDAPAPKAEPLGAVPEAARDGSDPDIARIETRRTM